MSSPVGMEYRTYINAINDYGEMVDDPRRDWEDRVDAAQVVIQLYQQILRECMANEEIGYGNRIRFHRDTFVGRLPQFFGPRREAIRVLNHDLGLLVDEEDDNPDDEGSRNNDRPDGNGDRAGGRPGTRLMNVPPQTLDECNDELVAAKNSATLQRARAAGDYVHSAGGRNCPGF